MFTAGPFTETITETSCSALAVLAVGASVCIFCAETNHHRLKRTHSCYSLTGAVVQLDLGVGSVLSSEDLTGEGALPSSLR